jgi:hypothetical protein
MNNSYFTKDYFANNPLVAQVPREVKSQYTGSGFLRDGANILPMVFRPLIDNDV